MANATAEGLRRIVHASSPLELDLPYPLLDNVDPVSTSLPSLHGLTLSSSESRIPLSPFLEHPSLRRLRVAGATDPAVAVRGGSNLSSVELSGDFAIDGAIDSVTAVAVGLASLQLRSTSGAVESLDPLLRQPSLRGVDVDAPAMHVTADDIASAIERLPRLTAISLLQGGNFVTVPAETLRRILALRPQLSINGASQA